MGPRSRRLVWGFSAVLVCISLLSKPSAGSSHHINSTICCRRAIAESNDSGDFGLNYKEWNAEVGGNQSIPALRPNTPENKAWNLRVSEWTDNPNQGRTEFLDFRCGANYNSDGSGPTPSAPSIKATFGWCKRTPACNNYEVYHFSELNQWAGPLVGFLLPGLVFSMSIPRSWELTLPDKANQSRLRGGKLWQRMILYLIEPIFVTAKLLAATTAFESKLRTGNPFKRVISFVIRTFFLAVRLLSAVLITAIETILWVTIIFVCAGPMMVGGIYELLLDHRLLNKLRRLETDSRFQKTAANEVKKRKILSTLLLGNLSGEEGDPIADSESFIVNSSAVQAKIRLRSLLESQASFGTAVGAPVTFYIGAYAYALLDAQKNLGDNDTSHALALGLWYSIFVLVAIICGCLLGCSNPATIEGIVAYEAPPSAKISALGFVIRTNYKPVSIWNRGLSAYQWAKSHRCKEKVSVKDWICYMWLFSALLISVPCWLAFLVSYFTPEIGIGCRSFMVFLYWLSQMILITFVIFIEKVNNRLILSIGLVFAMLALLVSLFTATGGTILQIAGIYRNCWCKAGIRSFIHRNGPYMLEYATDTALDRHMASTWWTRTGIVGLGLVAIICLVAWWYQRDIRRNCSRFISGLEELPQPESDRFMLRASMASHQLPYRQYVAASVSSSPAHNIFLGPEASGVHMQLRDGHLVVKYNPLDTDLSERRFYVHINMQRDRDGNLREIFEMTLLTHPDSEPAGRFAWQGDRLGWDTVIDGETKVLDGFVLAPNHTGSKSVFINRNGYGVVTPPTSDIDVIKLKNLTY